jgi:SUMO ligase MMS21 Smc5/6 complex component
MANEENTKRNKNKQDINDIQVSARSSSKQCVSYYELGEWEKFKIEIETYYGISKKIIKYYTHLDMTDDVGLFYLNNSFTTFDLEGD